MAMLKVENLSIKYGSIEAVKNVSFEVNEGEVVTLIGANGAGKTSILRTISGLVRPTEGTISYLGNEIHKTPALIPMIDPNHRTVGFVDAKQILPVADEIRKSGYFKYCLRQMASGGRYYVIKDGMVVRGAVLPVKMEPLAKSELRGLADMVAKTADVADVEDLSKREGEENA